MDKRIIDLKKQIIKENIEKIETLSETGLIEFTSENNFKLLDDFDSETNFITAIQTDGKNIWVRALSDGEIFDNDAEFMDLEELDYNITGVLDNLIKNK